MTPEREAYLAKCSKRETILRHWIKICKNQISLRKFGLNYDKTFDSEDIEFCLSEIRFQKDRMNCFRHELQRLKGMDRVAVPYELMRFGFKANIPGVSYNCECFEPIDRKQKFCPNCGRKILWEKVK